MKKLYLIVALLLNLQAFAGRNAPRLSDDTWTLLIILGVILIIILAYLFLQASLEHFFRNKEIEKIHEGNEDENEEKEGINKDLKNTKSSDELLNLFMLKRKGVISEREYHQLKERLIKNRSY